MKRSNYSERIIDNLVQLMEQAKNGDLLAIEELIGMFQPLILNLARDFRIDLRDDAIEELKMGLIEAIHRFKVVEPKGAERDEI